MFIGMKKRIRIKDIAIMAGVSAGTVDRVLHNRGNVSEDAREAVEKVLKKVDYKPNIHISGLSLRKDYNIVVTTPNAAPGEYWEKIHNGIQLAVSRHESINIRTQYLTYDQYNIYSCQDVFTQILLMSPDAVIIGPTYKDETIDFTNKLKEKSIPFVLVDSLIEGCSPLAYYSANHYICGYLMSKLLFSLISKQDELAVLQAIRIGDQSANTSILRREGALAYLKEVGYDKPIHNLLFSAYDMDENELKMREFFKRHPQVKGVIVLNSRGNIVSNVLKKCDITDVRLVALDLTDSNVESLREDKINFLIDQNPDYQGYMAMKTLLEHMVLKIKPKEANIMPLNIVTKETVDLQLDFNFLRRI